tara:strand:- start:51729 stop:52211 length:483 start_codon:yes stop_codon:yes gene_type:complete
MTKPVDLKVPLSVNQVKKMLPQRYPFLMVDRVIEVVPSASQDGFTGRKVVIQKNVSVNEPYFNGHFPDYPLLPGVMQVEGMAQACAVCSYTGKNEGQEMVITGINKARFRRPVVPGDILKIEATIIRYRSKIAIFHCIAMVDGEVVSEAEIMASSAQTSE